MRKPLHLQIAVRGGSGVRVLFGGGQMRELSICLTHRLIVPPINLRQPAGLRGRAIILSTSHLIPHKLDGRY